MVHASFDACALHDDATDGCRVLATESGVQVGASVHDARFPQGFPARNEYGLPTAVDSLDVPIPFRPAVPDYSDVRHALICELDDATASLGVSELEALVRVAQSMIDSPTVASALLRVLLTEEASR